MSGAESSSSSASSERDWNAIMDELKKSRAQVKNLQVKLSNKVGQHEVEAKAKVIVCVKRKRRSVQVLDIIRHQMRKVQNITGCSTRTLNVALQHLQPFLVGCVQIPKKKFAIRRIRARKKSRCKRLLNGCIGCHKYVFGPKELIRSCPLCGHDRYKGGTRQPNEVCVKRGMCQTRCVFECDLIIAFSTT